MAGSCGENEGWEDAKTIAVWRAVKEEGMPWNKKKRWQDQMARPNGRRPARLRFEVWVVSAVSESGGKVCQLS